jgi:hypothetical protein
MNLESRVLEVFQKNPEKDFTTVEIVIDIYGIKPARMLHIDHYSKLWEVQGALNSLVESGVLEWRIVGSPSYAVLYRLKNKKRKENYAVTESLGKETPVLEPWTTTDNLKK